MIVWCCRTLNAHFRSLAVFRLSCASSSLGLAHKLKSVDTVHSPEADGTKLSFIFVMTSRRTYQLSADGQDLTVWSLSAQVSQTDTSDTTLRWSLETAQSLMDQESVLWHRIAQTDENSKSQTAWAMMTVCRCLYNERLWLSVAVS